MSAAPDRRSEETPLWTPSPEVIRRAEITRYRDWLAQERGLAFESYDALWRWSTEELEAFWASLWDYFDVAAASPYERVLADPRMPGARWFTGARLNYVDQVLRHATEVRPAIVFRDEAGNRGEMSHAELRRQVAGLAATLKGLGVRPGDRVVAYLPNRPETVVAFLAVASIGAVWSVCAPDMGEAAVLDRFRQIEPKVLIACDGARFAGRDHDRAGTLSALLDGLPSVEALILRPILRTAGPLPRRTLLWDEAVAPDVPLIPEPLPFDHPLWIVYSSGTTGLPKAILHGHGGILLESLKGMALHNDIGPGDRFHWYSSTGWIMWNCQVAGLLVGATVALYDGSPTWPDPLALWRFAADECLTVLGAGAAFFANAQKADLHPGRDLDLSGLRGLGATGSPLSPETYRWIYERVRPDVWLNVISGGTDFAGAFVAGLPTLPLHAGEMQCRCLGARVEAWDEAGRPLTDQVGELVCTTPIPSMPLRFWKDGDDRRYRESYFETWPGVWRHGDWIRVTPRGGAVIYGRSDATINRAGVRMGTSELYRVVEAMPEVADSLVVDLEYLGRPSFMPLFVVLRDGLLLSPELEARIRERIRAELSARHVPNAVVQVPEVPRTLSGKKMELPVKKLLLGMDADGVANRDAMANPGSLDAFVAYARERAAGGSA